MTWLKRITLAAALAIAGTAGMAQGFEESILTQLRQQGFTEFVVSRTLLGRLHILAFSADYRRELVLNPNNGEILRDYLTALDGSVVTPILVAPDRDGGDDNSGHGNGDDDGGGDDDDDGGDDDDHGGHGHGGGDDDDDDDGGDDDDDDNSGHGNSDDD
jgi:hypothetical protein